MLRRVREPFGKAGLIVAVVALVAALVGGAYAASGGLTGKQKKEVKKIAKQYAGKEGAQGPVGSQGAKGDAGAAGANGTNGKDGERGEKGDTGNTGNTGADGKSVEVIPSPGGPGEPCEGLGGAELIEEGESVGAEVCNGSDGEGGGVLVPHGKTIAGYWEVQGAKGLQFNFGTEVAVTMISFPLRLESAPAETILISAGNTPLEKEKCPGELESPVSTEAAPGVLCLYTPFPVTFIGGSATTFGAGLQFGPSDEAFGSWAVLAP